MNALRDILLTIALGLAIGMGGTVYVYAAADGALYLAQLLELTRAQIDIPALP